MTTDLQAISSHNPAGYRDVPPGVAARNLSAFRLIDVREPDEFTGPLGRIEGAELFPLATVVGKAAAWDRKQPLLVICRSGGRSARAAAGLAALGFVNVYNLTGGMTGWEANQLPRVVG